MTGKRNLEENADEPKTSGKTASANGEVNGAAARSNSPLIQTIMSNRTSWHRGEAKDQAAKGLDKGVSQVPKDEKDDNTLSDSGLKGTKSNCGCMFFTTYVKPS